MSKNSKSTQLKEKKDQLKQVKSEAKQTLEEFSVLLTTFSQDNFHKLMKIVMNEAKRRCSECANSIAKIELGFKRKKTEATKDFIKYLQVNENGELIGDYRKADSSIKYFGHNFSRSEIQNAFKLASEKATRDHLKVKLYAYYDLYKKSFPEYLKVICPDKSEELLEIEKEAILKLTLKRDVIPALFKELNSLFPCL